MKRKPLPPPKRAFQLYALSFLVVRLQSPPLTEVLQWVFVYAKNIFDARKTALEAYRLTYNMDRVQSIVVKDCLKVADGFHVPLSYIDGKLILPEQEQELEDNQEPEEVEVETE